MALGNSDQKKFENWIGPFPSKPTSKSMSFWLSIGPNALPEKIKIQFWPHDNPNDKREVDFMFLEDSVYGVYTAELESLIEDKQYFYSVIVDDVPWTGELKPNDFRFWTLPKDDRIDEFVLMSCHGVEAYEHEWDESKPLGPARTHSKADFNVCV